MVPGQGISTLNGTEEEVYSFLLRKYNKATLNPNELASEYSSHPTRVRKLCADGAIQAVKVGGNRWVIPLASAARFLAGGTDDEQ